MGFSKKGKAALALLGIVTLAGIGAWIYQLANGLGVTGMNNANSWGLYITNFMFFVGLSAGGLIVASSAHVFNIESFKRVSIPAVVCSIVCICLAGLFVLIDLGGVQRFWRLFTGPNFMSPLMWDVCVILCYLVINVLDLVFLVKGKQRAVKALSYVALPVAILVHSVTAWIFGLEIAREGWHTAILAPIFVGSALDSGLALLVISLLALRAGKIFDAGKDLIAKLARLLAVFIAVDAYLIACEVLTTAYDGTDAGNAILSQMTVGVTAPYFWFEIIAGLLIPFVLLCFNKVRTNAKLLAVASALVVCGVFCKRVWLLFTSFIAPNVMAAPGITLGTQAAIASPSMDAWTILGSYAPTIVELVVVAGVVALGALVFMVACKVLLGSVHKPDDGTMPAAVPLAA